MMLSLHWCHWVTLLQRGPKNLASPCEAFWPFWPFWLGFQGNEKPHQKVGQCDRPNHSPAPNSPETVRMTWDNSMHHRRFLTGLAVYHMISEQKHHNPSNAIKCQVQLILNQSLSVCQFTRFLQESHQQCFNNVHLPKDKACRFDTHVCIIPQVKSHSQQETHGFPQSSNILAGTPTIR